LTGDLLKWMFGICDSLDPLLLIADSKHSHNEERYHALGKTDEGRTLHITFTLRKAGEKIRVISARDMHKNERTIYEQTT
jgi:uncharacterized protein